MNAARAVVDCTAVAARSGSVGKVGMAKKVWMFDPDGGGVKVPERTKQDVQRNTPTHLSRLRHFSADRWTCGFYKYSDATYELCIMPSGDFFCIPEEGFELTAGVYLGNG